MRTEELKEYLGIVVDMEKNIYIQEQLVKSLTLKISTLGHPRAIQAPMKIKPNLKYSASIFEGGLSAIFSGGIIGGLICGVLSNNIDGMFYGAVVGAIIFFTTVIVCGCASVSAEAKANKAEQLRVQQIWDAEMSKYHEACEIDALRVKQELLQKPYFEQSLQQAQTLLSKSRSNLELIYSKNFLFPKYRNFIMASSLYEYICAGRCATLEGHEGAYNILEMEIRLDRIITQLDRIITQLDAIQQNQFMLYTAIQESNQKSAQILYSTSQMASSLQDFKGEVVNFNDHIAELQRASALTAYHTERAQKELAYMNRMNYLSGRNDDVFFNHPPV